MSCSSMVAKDFMNIENSTLSLDAQMGEDNNKNDGSTSCSEKENALDHQKANSNSSEDMNQTLDLFRKYLLPKTPHNVGKTNEEESEAIKRAPPRPLVPPKYDDRYRPPSFLERALLPELSHDGKLPTSLGEKALTAQLTIFYAGVINVYDDVPLDKAHAIMLLAGERSLSAPIAGNIPKTDVKKPLHRPSLPSVCKLQEDLPVARKNSLQRFLKRRRRIINNPPYASTNTRHESEDEPAVTATHCLNEKGSFTPSPFLGYSFSCVD